MGQAPIPGALVGTSYVLQPRACAEVERGCEGIIFWLHIRTHDGGRSEDPLELSTLRG